MKECVMCQAPFKPRGVKKTCSKPCSITYTKQRDRKNALDRYYANLKFDPIYKVCTICGAWFIARRMQETCSKVCSKALVKKTVHDWGQANPEKRRESARLAQRRNYPKNRDKILAFQKSPAGKAIHLKYRKSEKGRAKRTRRSQNYRAAGDFDVDAWNAKLKEHNYECVMCGTTERITIDHIIPISKGGTNHIDNLQPLCMSCNCSKGAKT